MHEGRRGPARRPTGSAFATPAAARRYRIVSAVLVTLVGAVGCGILAWDNPLPLGSEGFWLIARRRAVSVAVIALVVWCQGVATIAFHTITNNRIITPSIMGFESLYRLVQTAAVFFFGVAGLTVLRGPAQYLGQVAAMVLFAALLYGWLLRDERRQIHQTLLIGIVLGTGMSALSTYLVRALSPDEFDVLAARMMGNLSNADASHLTIAAPLAVAAGIVVLGQSRTLDVMALGRCVAVGLGVNHRRRALGMLVLVAVLMAVSTSLVGPMSFVGFLIAMLTYQLADTHSHRHLLPMAWLVGFVVLGGAYFVLRHMFYAEGSVTIIIEAAGGAFFLIYLLRKGRL